MPFCLFHERKRENMKNMEKGHSQKKQKIMFLDSYGKFFLLKWHFLNRQTLFIICVRKVKKRVCSLTLSVFGQCHFLCEHTKSPNTTKLGLSAGTGENPKWHFWLQKRHFGKGPRKGALLSVICKSCVLLKTQFYNRSLPKIGVVCQHAIQFWGGSFLFFSGLVFFFSVCLFFCFVKRPKRLFPSDLEFLYFDPPKGPSLKSFFFSYSVFSLCSFVFPFKSPSLSLSINPFWETLLLGGFFCLFICLVLY